MPWRLIQIFSGGIATGVAAEPVGYWWLAWVGLVPLWWQVRRETSLPQAAIAGAVWGLGFDGLTLHWITGLHPMDWMGVPWLQSITIALVCWVAITAVGAFPVVLWSLALRWLDRWTCRTPGVIADTPIANVGLVLVGAGLWAILETLMSQGVLWWPWLSLTQSPHNLVILQLDRLSGPTVVSAAIVAVNGLLALGLRRQATGRLGLSARRFAGRYVLGAVALVVGLHSIGWVLLDRDLFVMGSSAEPTAPLTIGIIQGNIPNEIKLYPGGIRRALLNYRDGYRSLTQSDDSLDPVDVVLTPETALPLLWNGRPNGYSPDGQLAQAIADHGTPIWLGTMQGTPQIYTNSLLTVGGTIEGGQLPTLSRYDKVKLVPLGEYIPFANLLGDVISRLSPIDAQMTVGDRRQIFDTPFGQAAVAICYESAFPEPLRRQVAAGAQFVLSVANNAHYTASMASQHHAQDVMRAIELDRPVARATNTGYSAIIDRHGRTRWKSEFERYEIHRDTLRPRTTLTPYVRWGNWLAWVSAIAIGGLGIQARQR